VTIAFYLLLAALLLFLNAFFVLAEFAAVKMRPSRVQALVDQGNARARIVQHVQARVDEYLSVCQVGITFASIGLGFVGEPAIARLIVTLTGASSTAAHRIAVIAAYLLVSFLHVLVGELIPKSLAIRRTEPAVLLTALPLKIFRWVFYPPLVILNGAANAVLALFGLPRTVREPEHTEEELKILLAQSQTSGLLSFRRLLLLENIFDLGGLRVRDAMRPRDAVKVLRAGAPWEENFRVLRETRFSRYPLVDGGELPVGIIHVKDLLYEGPGKWPTLDLRTIARPFVTAAEDAPLENLLGEFQRQRVHLAIVRNAEGRWTGFLSLEDLIEEILGTIEDEFEVEPPISLADALTPGRVVLDLEASSLEEVIGQAFGRVRAEDLPMPRERMVRAVLDRERAMSTYLGRGLAVPHARLEGLGRPVLLFVRPKGGVPVLGRDERAHLVFMLMTPAGAPRVQVRLLARICGLLDSEYVTERLLQARTPAEIVEAVRAAEPLAVS
jgi:CBS domain containing-hemolysin-like protein